jgi:hypothetical protein
LDQDAFGERPHEYSILDHFDGQGPQAFVSRV